MAKDRISAWEMKTYGDEMEEFINGHNDDELLELVEENPTIIGYLCNFHNLQDEVNKYGIVQVMYDYSHLFEGIYLLDGELYDLESCATHKWENYTGATYVSELSQEKQDIIRLVITGYVHTALAEYTEEEKQDAIESAMNERLCNICDAEIVRDLLAGAGII